MNSRQPVDLAQAYLLLNHGPVTLVSSAHESRRNVMAASWAMPLDFSPPKVAVVIDKSTHTRRLIEASGEFVLNIPTRQLAEQVLAVGSCSGKIHDKFAELGLESEAASRVQAPLVGGCAAWLECRILPEPDNQERYDLFIGEVVAAWADQRVFSAGRWHFSDDPLRTLHYLAGGNFLVSGEAISVGDS